MAFMETLKASLAGITGFFIYNLLVSTLGPFLFGYHLAELNAPSDVITCVRKEISKTGLLSLPQCIPMSPLKLGLVSSTYTIGGLCGALIAGPLSSRNGRLQPMRMMTIVAFIGAIGEAIAPSVAVMAVGRFISGIAAGASTVIVPLYISEIAPPANRGLFGALTQISCNMGIFLTQLIGYFLSHGQYWRIILAMAGAVAALQFFGLLFAVESPQWAAGHGKPRQAKFDLQRIRGDLDIKDEMSSWDAPDGDLENEEEQTLLAQAQPAGDEDPIKPTTIPQKKATVGFFEALRNPDYFPATVAVVMIMLAQQLCGINSVVMYGVSLMTDLLSSSSALLNIFISVLNIVVTTSCAPLSDVLGRKTAILISIGAQGISSLLLGIGLSTGQPVLSAVSVLLFVASFGFGLGPVPFILASELVGPEAVGAIQSWSLASNWLATFLVAQFFPILNEKLGKGVAYFLFAGMALFFFLFIGWWVPETKGKKDADEAWGREPRRED